MQYRNDTKKTGKQRKGSTMRKNQGFTLVEILIVVVILGILAAIVIPQFSDASTQSKVSSAKSSLQTLRSQISLYKIQHNDAAPALADFSTNMTTQIGQYGPYLQVVPKNPFNDSDTLAAADGATVGWVYDASDGSISLGGQGATDLNGDGDSEDTGETHIDW